MKIKLKIGPEQKIYGPSISSYLSLASCNSQNA
jgi:hypothetical protein